MGGIYFLGNISIEDDIDRVSRERFSEDQVGSHKNRNSDVVENETCLGKKKCLFQTPSIEVPILKTPQVKNTYFLVYIPCSFEKSCIFGCRSTGTMYSKLQGFAKNLKANGDRSCKISIFLHI